MKNIKWGVLAAAVMLIISVYGCGGGAESSESERSEESFLSSSSSEVSEESSQEESEISAEESSEESSEGSDLESSEESSEEESSESSEESTAESSEPESSLPDDADTDDWKLVVVNRANPISDDYDYSNITEKIGKYPFHYEVAEQLRKMFAAAKEDGYSLVIVSGYRTKERSEVLYNNKVAELKKEGYSEEEALEEAARWIAPPGTSEHHTGLAADIVQAGYFTKHSSLNWVFDEYPEFEWLYEHCAEYGFILRYPKDKQDVTKITYEPWHYRYVGVEHAKKIMDAGVCLEEYVGLAEISE